MKRVKTFSMKYWIAGGLHNEPSQTFVELEQHSRSPVTPIAGQTQSNQAHSTPPSLNENRPGLSSNQQYHDSVLQVTMMKLKQSSPLSPMLLHLVNSRFVVIFRTFKSGKVEQKDFKPTSNAVASIFIDATLV